MRTQFKVKTDLPLNKYLQRDIIEQGQYFARSCICRSAIMECKVIPADEYLITISSQPIKGSKKYDLVENNELSYGISYLKKGCAHSLYIFESLQRILLPFFKGKEKVRIYFLAENV